MNLVLDVGNHGLKLAVYENHKKVVRHEFPIKEGLDNLFEFLNQYPIKRGIIADVGLEDEAVMKKLKKEYNIQQLTPATKIPFQNKYKTPKTLGMDRVALVSAAALKFPKKNVLVIDAGSCITYDIKDTNNCYHGGAISLGIKMRYKALNTYTKNLPQLNKDTDEISIIGTSTSDCIHSGVLNGVVFEMDSFISNYQKTFKNLTVVLTGGDVFYLSEKLKSSIFVDSEFLLKGLNSILEYNNTTGNSK